MKRIIVQFCAFDSFFGKMIDWGTQGTVGHVDAVMPDGSLLGAQHEDGLGGMPSGVWIRPADYGASSGMQNVMRATFSVSTQQLESFYGFLQAQIGKPYDISAIAAFALGRDWHHDGSWICSELIAAALEEAAVIRKLAAPCNRITPEALMLAVSAVVPVVSRTRLGSGILRGNAVHSSPDDS